LVGFALTQVFRRIYAPNALLEPVYDDSAGALGQGRQLGQIIATIAPGQDGGHQNGPFFSDF
jgi:hypothetical protein